MLHERSRDMRGGDSVAAADAGRCMSHLGLPCPALLLVPSTAATALSQQHRQRPRLRLRALPGRPAPAAARPGSQSLPVAPAASPCPLTARPRSAARRWPSRRARRARRAPRPLEASGLSAWSRRPRVRAGNARSSAAAAAAAAVRGRPAGRARHSFRRCCTSADPSPGASRTHGMPSSIVNAPAGPYGAYVKGGGAGAGAGMAGGGPAPGTKPDVSDGVAHAACLGLLLCLQWPECSLSGPFLNSARLFPCLHCRPAEDGGPPGQLRAAHLPARHAAPPGAPALPGWAWAACLGLHRLSCRLGSPCLRSLRPNAARPALFAGARRRGRGRCPGRRGGVWAARALPARHPPRRWVGGWVGG